MILLYVKCDEQMNANHFLRIDVLDLICFVIERSEALISPAKPSAATEMEDHLMVPHEPPPSSGNHPHSGSDESPSGGNVVLVDDSTSSDQGDVVIDSTRYARQLP